LASFSFTSLYIKNIGPQLSFLWWPEPGILYSVYLVFGYLGIIGYACYELLKIYKTSTGYIHEQIKYILLAIIFGFGGGATNFPLWYKFPMLPYGNFLVVLYPFILSYAMVKYRLFEIKVVLTSLFVTLIAGLLLFNVVDSPTTFDYIWKGSLFIAFLIFGYLLIKSVWREIRQREKMEKMTIKLKEVNEKLKILDRAKSEFLSIASHQLRTPLSAIKGYLSMILEGSYGKVSKKVKKPIANVFKASNQLNQLVNTLLNVSRIESGKIKLETKKIRLKEIIAPIVEEFMLTAKEKGLYLKLSMPASLPLMSLDKQKINQVIMNIIDNAIKYTETGGITIKTTESKNKKKILIQISDTGLGMDKKQSKQIFEKFERGSAGKTSWASGAGLGLFIARKFTELHHGKIWAESKGVNKGSAFYIELPIN